MVPKGWKREPLVNVAEIRTGVAKGKKDLKDPISVPYLRVANVQDGHIDLTEIKTIEIEREKLAQYALKDGDVLMTEGGDFDKLGRGDVWREQVSPCVNQNHVFAVRVDETRLLPYYLSSLSGSHYGKSYFLSCAKKSTNLASINSTQLKEFPILIPPLIEQNKIELILSTWDQAIKTAEELIENSKAQKKTLMQQLLTGKKRLPGYGEEWQRYRLGQLFSERKETNRLDLPLLSITQNRGVIHRDEVGRKDTSSDDKTKYKRLCPDDIGYNTMRMWQGVSALSDKEGIVSPAYTIVTPEKSVSARYMAYLFKLPRTIHDFYRYSQGLVSDTWNLKFPNFSEVEVSVPTRSEQEAIADILNGCDNQTATLTRHAQNLCRQKKALMQQLLTGKRRVKVAA